MASPTDQQQKTNQKNAIVLSSGGALGAYEVGVMKALLTGQSPVTQNQPLDPSIFTGASIGAFNAAFMVSQQGETDFVSAINSLEQLWLEEIAETPDHPNGMYRFRINPDVVLDPRSYIKEPVETLTHLVEDSVFLFRESISRMVHLATSSDSISKSLIHFINLSSFVSVDPYEHLIEKTIQFENIQRSQIPLRIISTNWTQGNLVFFTNQELTHQLGPRMVRASGSLPGFFPSVEIEGQLHVDAGVLGYAKLIPAIEVNADIMHVIYPNPNVAELPQEHRASTFHEMFRTFDTIWSNRVRRSSEILTSLDQLAVFLKRVVENNGVSRDSAIEILLDMIPTGGFETAKTREGKNAFVQDTVHFYFPKVDQVGWGGFFDLNHKRVENLIRAGYNDTVHHNCEKNGCILPQQI